MNLNVDKLERDVEQQMRLLDDLPMLAPPAEVVARTKQTVLVEAGRVNRRRRQLRLVRTVSAAAAALALAIGLASFSESNLVPPISDSDLTLEDWSVALDDSSEQFAGLLDSDWIEHMIQNGTSPDQELEDMLDSLGETFESFEEL